MATRLATTVRSVTAAFDAATASDVQVVAGWSPSPEYGRLITVGVMLDGNGQPVPMARLDRRIMGGTTHNTETVALYCTLAVPADTGDDSPESAIDEAGVILGQCATALSALAINGRAWLSDALVWVSDETSGFGVTASFTAVVETYVA